MSEAAAFLIIGASWATIGVVLSLGMGRRGYDAWGWLIMGAILGPLAILLAFTGGEKKAGYELTAPTGHVSPGRTHVLVGIDGSPESNAAVRGVVDLFGDQLGRLTLATVIPYDTSREIERDAKAKLRRAIEVMARKGPIR